MSNEQDLRLKLFNSLLTTPHRNLAAIYPVHQEIISQDPLFYVRLAAWYAKEGEVRDHQEMFVVNLVLSDFPSHRDVGLALLRTMPPYQVGRVFDFIKGQVVKRKVKQDETDGADGLVTIKQGLFRHIPRSMKTEITRYLREREADPSWFDSSVLQARRAIKRLYASLHIRPSKRAQAILFDENPPSDSRLFALKVISRAPTAQEQAHAIVAHKIPYRVAVSVIKEMTPEVLAALVNNMSPQEVINNLKSLKARGAFEMGNVKPLIDEKLEKAQGDKRVAAFKAQVAAAATDLDAETRSRLERITDEQVKKRGQISKPTALFVDKSASMENALELGKHIAAMISGISKAGLFVYAFDKVAYPIQAGEANDTLPSEGLALSDWERAFQHLKAGGTTSLGAPLQALRQNQQVVEQIILVTDEQENAKPYFADVYQTYQQEQKVAPNVVIVKVGQASDWVEQQVKALASSGEVDTFTFAGDYYALPNLIPLLTRPSRLDLLIDIMSTPLPKRRQK